MPGGGPKQFVVDVDTPNARVVIGSEDQLLRSGLAVNNVMWADIAPVVDSTVLVQCSAHGAALPAVVQSLNPLVLRFNVAQRRIAPGQSVVCYDPSNSFVLGGGIADASNPATGDFL